MALIGQAVSEKKIFENGGRRRTDDGRTPDHGHPISSPCEPNGSGELKTLKNLFLQNQKAYDFETWHETLSNGALQNLYKL